MDLWESRKELRDDGRRGVVGRELGLRLREEERLALLSTGVAADIVPSDRRFILGSRANRRLEMVFECVICGCKLVLFAL